MSISTSSTDFKSGKLFSEYPFHPLVVGSTQSGVPMIKNSEFDGHDVSASTIDSLSSEFDLLAETERPFGISPRGIENGRDVISQYDRGKEADVDVASDLEDVLILPALHGKKVALATDRLWHYSLFLVFLLQRVPRRIHAILIDGQQVLGNFIMVSREHKQNCDNGWRHHHDPLGRNGIGENGSILVSPDADLFFVCVAIQSTEIDVARCVIDKWIGPGSLETFVDDDGCKRKEEAIQARGVLAKGTLALQKSLVNGFIVWQIGTLWLHGRDISGIGRSGFAHFRVPRIVGSAIVAAIPGAWTSDGGSWVRQIGPQH